MIKNIALISPPTSLEERYGELAGAGSTMPTLGLLMLAAVSKKAGYVPTIIEAAAYNLSQRQTLDEVMKTKPELVGITATTLSIFNASETARVIKELLPDTITVVGGPHVSAVPVETLDRFPSFDLAVLSEGEETFVDLLDALAKGRDLSEVQGLAIRTPDGIKLTDPRPVIKDLDSLPYPAWELLPGFPEKFHPAAFRYKQLPAATVVTSRGCPNRCLFCDRTVFGRSCRLYSAEYVLEMIGHLHKTYGVKELVFEDDTFVMHKSRVLKICEGLKKSGWGITWTALGRVDMVDPDLLRAMKEAGCWQIGYGVESGDQSILDLVEKKIKLERISQALKWTKEAGMLTKGFFIMGFPTETKATLQKTIDFAKREALDDMSVFKLTPLPGSKIYEIAPQYGTFDNDWRKMNLLDVVFVPHGLTAADLDEASKRMLKEFYLRPKIMLSYLARLAGHPGLIGPLINGFFAFMRQISRK